MSSLQEKVIERRAAESAEPRCVSLQPGGSGLVVCQWHGESWVFPWSQFVSARLCGADVDARLELTFANYIVTVMGENLQGLLEHLAASRLGCIRDVPAQYQPPVGGDAPFIAHIGVQSLSPAKGERIR